MFSQNWFEAVVEVVMEKPVRIPSAKLIAFNNIEIGWVNFDCLIVAEVEVIFERERAF